MREEFVLNNILVVFGENIKKVRERKGLSISTAAVLTGYYRSGLSKLELGRQEVRLSTAIKIAKAYDVSFPALFSRNFMNGDKEQPYMDNDYLGIFIENFQKALKANGYTEMTVSETVNVTNYSVSKIVRGKYTNPELSTLNGMAYTVKMDLEQLFLRK